jgi:cysteinyl-tRNA synthetase
MQHKIYIYNTLTRKKELLDPINPGHVGMYVCGPTVYGDAHIGHARPAITFDLVFRYFKYLGLKVRYVRNITDVGHLENDADEGEDKIQKKARIEQLEPMEVAQHYIDRYHFNMDELNVLRPSIEARASGHIMEQIEMAEKILNNGYAYESDGNLYFNVEKYNQKYNYGKLSGRKLEDMISNTRELQGQKQKRNPFDFALWKKASPEHIMRWNSPWSEGFPGWHLECSAMGAKYLGEQFDIHGGGLDLQFPHHECEIAQSMAANGKEAVKYWMHNNLITISQQKMGKSLGNFITLFELFNGSHDSLEKAYNPMTVRFFILQAHYRNPLDFSNTALQAAEKGLERLFNAMDAIENIKPLDNYQSTVDVRRLRDKCFDTINDDFNTPVLVSHLFDGVRMINSIIAGSETINSEDLKILKELYYDFVVKILGIRNPKSSFVSDHLFNDIVDLLLQVRVDSKAKRDYETADKIRSKLNDLGFDIKDKKDGFEWELK